MSAPIAMPPPAGAPTGQNVTYYVYQMPAPSAGPNISIDWSNCFQFYFLRPLLVFLLWASWTILIAGCATYQHTCNKGELTSDNNPFPWNWGPYLAVGVWAPLGISNGGSVAGDCAQLFALLWWCVWLQFVCVCLATATTWEVILKYKHVKGLFTTTLYFFIMSSVLLFFQADYASKTLYYELFKLPSVAGFKNGAYLTLVGAVTCLIFNFIYLIWNSYQDVPVDTAADVEEPAPVEPTPAVEVETSAASKSSKK